MKAFFTRLFKFAGVSGAGLAIDYAIFLLLAHSLLPAGWANLISAGIAVSFVFVVSTRHVFEGEHEYLWRKFAAYAAFQVLAVVAASVAVGWLDELLDGRHALAKAITLPFTFTANFAFMSWILRDRAPQSDSRKVS